MSRYIDADKFWARIVDGKPPVFDHEEKHLIKSLLDQEPTVDMPPVVHERWVFNHLYGHLFHCSRCGAPSNNTTPFCPGCGSRMDGEVDCGEEE